MTVDEHVGAIVGIGRWMPSAGRTRRTRVPGASEAPAAASRPSRVAIYARYGTGGRGWAPGDEIDACRRAVPGLVGGPVEHVTFTDARPGHAVAGRPGLDALRHVGRSPGLGVLIVESPDRLSRDAAQLDGIWT